MTALGSWAPPLRHHAIFHSTDADDARAFFAGKQVALALQGDGAGPALDTQVNVAYLPNVELCYLQYGVAATARIGTHRDDYRIQLPLHGRAETDFGGERLVCHPGMAAITSPTAQQTIRSGADCGRLLVMFSREALTRHLSALLGEGVDAPLRFAPAMAVGSGPGRSLASLVELAVGDLDRDASGLMQPLAASQFEQLLMTMLLSGQPHNYSERMAGRRDGFVAPRAVRRALDYIRSHPHLPITVQELVAVSGVPGRTLYLQFQRFIGQPPLGYLRLVRLERVRADLLAAAPGETVITIALRWGFTHPGRFAAVYRRRYGETPSQTLARARRS